MGLRLFSGRRSQFVTALAGATLLTVLWLLLLASTGAQSLRFAPSSGWSVVLGPLVVGPLVAVVFTAVPEEFAYRGFLYHALSS